VPPLSGFVGKLMLMRALEATALGPVIWAALLTSGLVVALVLARAASALFWEPTPGDYAVPDQDAAPHGAEPLGALHAVRRALPLALLVAVSPLLAVGAAPIAAYAAAAAEQLSSRAVYVAAVLGDAVDIESIDRRRRP
jgi:multicomponent K+:H+ antiporter subunit D